MKSFYDKVTLTHLDPFRQLVIIYLQLQTHTGQTVKHLLISCLPRTRDKTKVDINLEVKVIWMLRVKRLVLSLQKGTEYPI